MSYSQTIANWELPGITLKRVAPTNGGEYVSPCPDCGGDDRFHVWPNEGSNGRFWCRQCGKSGDMIEFLRWQKGMSFKEACESVGKHLPQRRRIVTDTSFSKNSPTPVAIQVKPHKRIKNDLSWLKPKKPEEYKFIPQPLEAERTNQQTDESSNPTENPISEYQQKTVTAERQPRQEPLTSPNPSFERCKNCANFDVEDDIAWCLSGDSYLNHEHIRVCPREERESRKESSDVVVLAFQKPSWIDNYTDTGGKLERQRRLLRTQTDASDFVRNICFKCTHFIPPDKCFHCNNKCIPEKCSLPVVSSGRLWGERQENSETNKIS